MAQKQTKILSVHIKREVARKKERDIQQVLDTVPKGSRQHIARENFLAENHVPTWAHGVRVRPAGPFSVVEATVNRGR
jgi:hypothetical protein